MADPQQLDGPRWGPRSGGAPRQLVVLLHGVGADGHDLIGLAPRWSQAVPEAAFVAPHAPFPCEGAPFGWQWFGIEDRTPARLEAGVRLAAAVLERFLAAELARHGLPPAAPLALMGFSQGAMTALFAGLRRRPPPAAILAYSGALLAPESLAVERAGRPPVLLVHGEADETVPAAASRAAEQALRAAGVPVEAYYAPRLGHGIDEAGLALGALFLQRAFSVTAR
ncbi:alpha/beta hydrolase [Caldovatus aquaticus]|uniref:Prolyl oligopeptidase family serine peptidase n=1 Tax=Caldovatus aquaticus TaxID=2865671 RepID=A0ABS7F722_9PROT|nr:prolyl oligopeptidase family serine peptidase [Caldovatus aquaticus]MBW8270621.1 prolyl oligopeptidase family serine peptidase [Caldovatus aquaticus]